jgi:Helix-turn-helix domain
LSDDVVFAETDRPGRVSEGDPVRKKIFGMIAVPLDRNEKAKLLFRARCLMRATEKGRAYGPVSAKAYAVFAALLMGFHNCRDGRCFPSYDRICEAAGCCRQTVAASLAALEAAGLLGVCNRLVGVMP